MGSALDCTTDWYRITRILIIPPSRFSVLMKKKNKSARLHSLAEHPSQANMDLLHSESLRTYNLLRNPLLEEMLAVRCLLTFLFHFLKIWFNCTTWLSFCEGKKIQSSWVLPYFLLLFIKEKWDGILNQGYIYTPHLHLSPGNVAIVHL